MYKANGYFCCAAGLSAFELENGFVGCTDDISVLGSGTTLLAITSSGSSACYATPNSVHHNVYIIHTNDGVFF
jgi:hypothetical protein